MNLGSLRTELLARTSSELTTSRANQFLNDAMHEFQEFQPWPWLETTTTGTAPLTISDLRQVLYVLDTTNKTELVHMDVRDLAELDTDITTAGTPSYFWLDGQTTLKVYPTSTTDSLSVRYVKVATDLSSDSDTPTIPTRYHSIIVDLAQLRVLQETADNPDLASALRAEVDRKLTQVVDTQLSRNYALAGGPLVLMTEDW